MKMLAYFRLIKNRIDRLNYAVENPILTHDSNNPFNKSFNKTYVWVEANEENDSSQ